MISDELFLYLTKKIIHDHSQIELFVNRLDNYIYLAELRDGEIVFIANGKVFLNFKNQIDNYKTDNCLFIFSAKNNKFKCIDKYSIKKIIECVSIDEYSSELKRAFVDTLNKLSKKQQIDYSVKEIFKRHKNNISKLKIFIQRGINEDVFKYASRIGNPFVYKQKCYVEEFNKINNYIMNLWSNAFYFSSKEREIFEKYILRIMNDFNLRYNIMLN